MENEGKKEEMEPTWQNVGKVDSVGSLLRMDFVIPDFPALPALATRCPAKGAIVLFSVAVICGKMQKAAEIRGKSRNTVIRRHLVMSSVWEQRITPYPLGGPIWTFNLPLTLR